MADQSMQPDKKRKITLALLALVFLVILWQLYGLFSSNAPAPTQNTANKTTLSNSQKMPASKSLIPETAAKTAEDKLRENASNRYLAAVDELQLLKVNKQIAETNRDIAKAGQETVNAQRNTLEILSGIMPPSSASGYAANLSAQPSQPIASAPVQAPSQSENYVVVSVSMLQGKWSAVLGNQGQLFNVSSGDIIPLDQSKILSIDRSGVVISDKMGNKKRLSLVPVI